MDLGNLLFNFRGRINRAKFWLAVLIYLVVQTLAWLLVGMSTSEGAGALLVNIVGLAVFVSGIFVAIKRLHDRNRSGWWLLLFYIAPGVLMTAGAAIWFLGILGDASAGAGAAGAVFMLAGAAIGIWAFVELGCLRGTVGPNQYGPDPLEPTQAPAPAR
jgi:uncharacterized membrane protein YhaH (DUF805 family)